MEYKMFLRMGGRIYRLPVLPEKLEVESRLDLKKTKVLSLGEVVIPHGVSLKKVKWSCYLPAKSRPVETIRRIKRQREKKRPIGLILIGFDLDINQQFWVEDFDYQEQSGEIGDIYYDITLVEFKDLSPRKLELPAAPAGETAQDKANQEVTAHQKSNVVPLEVKSSRASDYVPPAVYVVENGDTKWTVAKKVFGRSNRADFIEPLPEKKTEGAKKKKILAIEAARVKIIKDTEVLKEKAVERVMGTVAKIFIRKKRVPSGYQKDNLHGPNNNHQ